MSTPEPLDEHPAPAPVEIRGGDRDEDFMSQPVLPFDDSKYCGGSVCDCGTHDSA